ncbi:type II secretion system minor pseudopilin GspI [Thiothrix lacustris]|uniref:Type II secretion system protein I n=1 Tax=Thiothrix lacustris TaxID=525917 RepID=A0ABY9MP35_9GAMM|nr:type II secretion system minor pseudopilin GspI [Thiothrix lacustris]WML89626.1 type II secretion system minor pseudopilin GspI [Thiothrix lacustris]WMP18798.1 type II secretion system minor pseudopilin GspI [Thiothrix lacustris]
MRQQQGFNLIEIMFALLLLGLVITVSVETSSGDIASYNRMKETTLARWVAFNQLAVVQTGKGFPAIGKAEGKVEMGDVPWQWQQEISATPDADLRKVKVSVFREGQASQVLAVELAYVANPQPKRRLGQ